MSPDTVFGFLNINKPAGLTSHDVVARVRRGTKTRKVGHAGTLDPMASGVLVLCMGPATRLSDYAMHGPKHYQASVRLGVETDTYDAEGQVVAEAETTQLTLAQVEAALTRFRGEIEQVPPMYSAIKQGGKKLYELARKGQVVERPPRRVMITHLDLLSHDLPDLVLDVACSSGTYIRSLAHDLGAALGVGAHLTGLVRVASGPFTVDDAIALDAFEATVTADTWRDVLLPPGVVLQDMPRFQLDAAQTIRVQHGNAIPVTAEANGEVRAYTPDGWLLAIMAGRGDAWQPVKVFLPPT